MRRSRSRSTASSGGARRPAPTALDVAARILARAPRTEADLEDRLVRLGYRPATAAATVARCRELHWVGDTDFARERARTLRRRGAGSLRIASDLAARGLSEALVDEAVAASRDGEPEEAWARRTLGNRPAGPAAWRFLAGRGFPDDVIADLLGDP